LSTLLLMLWATDNNTVSCRWDNVIGITTLYCLIAWVFIAACSYRMHFGPKTGQNWKWCLGDGKTFCCRNKVVPAVVSGGGVAVGKIQGGGGGNKDTALAPKTPRGWVDGKQTPLTGSNSWAIVIGFLNGFLVAAVSTRSMLLSLAARGDPRVRVDSTAGSSWKATIAGYDNDSLWSYSIVTWVLLIMGCALLQFTARSPKYFPVVSVGWAVSSVFVIVLFELSTLFATESILHRSTVSMF
jgi:hypothetical protein